MVDNSIAVTCWMDRINTHSHIHNRVHTHTQQLLVNEKAGIEEKKKKQNVTCYRGYTILTVLITCVVNSTGL